MHPGHVWTARLEIFELAPSRLIGELKRALEAAIETGELEPRREDAYYIAYLARTELVPGLARDKRAQLIASGGNAVDDDEGPHKGIDPDDPSPGVLACGHDPDNDPCLHRDADPEDPAHRR